MQGQNNLCCLRIIPEHYFGLSPSFRCLCAWLQRCETEFWLTVGAPASSKRCWTRLRFWAVSRPVESFHSKPILLIIKEILWGYFQQRGNKRAPSWSETGDAAGNIMFTLLSLTDILLGTRTKTKTSVCYHEYQEAVEVLQRNKYEIKNKYCSNEDALPRMSFKCNTACV